MIVSHEYYIWFVSALTVITGVAWVPVDVIRARRAMRTLPKGSPERRDHIFGAIMGIGVAVVGWIGVALYHLGG